MNIRNVQDDLAIASPLGPDLGHEVVNGTVGATVLEQQCPEG